MTTAQTEARAVLSVDDKWSVEYDPLDNDRPMQVLRYGEPTAGRTTGWNNDAHAMFYALLARDAELAALKKQVEELTKALEFYADVSKYPAPLTGGMGDLWADCGQIARAALTSTRETGK